MVTRRRGLSDGKARRVRRANCASRSSRRTTEHTPSSRCSTRSAARSSAPALPWIELLSAFVLAEGGAPQARSGDRRPRCRRSQAALVNATAAHSFEFDDIHMGGMIHPGALCLAAALAVGEQAAHRRPDSSSPPSSRAARSAHRVGRAVGTAHFRAGYHPQGTVGVFCAAGAAGRAMGLDAHALSDALGIAGTHAGGLMAAQEGSMAKRLHSGPRVPGRRAQRAVFAAAGFTGIANVLEADFGGFCSTMGGGAV